MDVNKTRGQTLVSPRAQGVARAAMVTWLALLVSSSAFGQSLAPTGYWQYNGTGLVTGTLASSGTNTAGVVTAPGTAPSYTTSGMVGSGIDMAYATLPTTQPAVEYLDFNIGIGAASAPSGGYALGNTFSIGTWYFVSNISTGARTQIWEGESDFDLSFGNGSSGDTTATAYGGGGANVSVAAALTTGTWRHVLQVFNSVSGSTTTSVYVDGVLSGTTARVASSTISDTGFRIGTARGTGVNQVRPLYGLVDETAVWANQALTASQALDVYNRGLAGVYLTNTNAVRGYVTGTTANAWLTGANWGGSAPGVTASASSTNGDVAVVGNYAFTGGLGIDMGTASGNLALGAISFNSLAGSGNLSIGNSSATSGTLTLNGAQIDNVSNVILNNEGLSNLTIANVQGSDSGQRMTLQLGGATSVIRAATGRTLTIGSDIIERNAGSTLTIDGGGNVTLTGSNFYTGPTTVSSGTLQIGGGGTSGSLAANITNASAVVFNRSDASTYAGSISGTGTVVKQGAGTLTVSGSNSYSGVTSVSAGTLVFGGTQALYSGSTASWTAGNLRVSSGATAGFAVGGSGFTDANVATLAALGTGTSGFMNGSSIGLDTSGAGGSFTLSSPLANPNAGANALGLTKLGSGTLVLTGSNSITGAAAVQAGTLVIGSGTTGSLNAVSGVSVASGATLAFNRSDAYGGGFTRVVSGSGGVALQGGMLALSATNTYSGGTLITGGTLLAGNNGAFGSGAVTLAGGRLQLGSAAAIANDIVLTGSAASATIGGVAAVDYLLVAGGGGGGNDNAGGGGGGGVLSSSTTVNLTSYIVTVGTGGAGGATTVRGGNGGNSTIFGLTAIGGGGGASGNSAASASASSGGSGGGGEGESGGTKRLGAAGTLGQGFAGGDGGGSAGGDFGGGGGGGAGGVGGNATGATTGTNGGVGGIGFQSFISGSGVYYGGGGGGGSSNNNTFVASGGLGGGGSGSINNGGAGTNGLGGGGGGSGFGTSANGGAGGSGVVIVRYFGGTSGTGGTITSGSGSAAGYTLHTFTATGSSTLALTAMDATLSGRISGTGGFTWNSAGRLTLSGSNSFTGGLIVGSGTVQAAGPNALGAGVVTLGNGGALAGTGTFSTGGLVFGTTAGNTSTVAMTVSGGAPATGFAVGGNILANGGSNSVTFAFGTDLSTIGSGTYALATYTGSLSGLNAFTWSGSKGGRQAVGFADSGSALNLVISNAFPIWTGSNGTGWSTTDNWKLNDDGSPTSFQTSDTVVFADGAVTGTVSLAVVVSPLTTTVNADALDYRFEDAGGRIAAGSLAKSGSATLTILGSNSYTAGTTLSAGTLRVGNNSALGGGAITVSGGRLATDNAANRSLANATTFTGDASLGADGDTANLTLSGSVSLGGVTRSLAIDSAVTFSGTVSSGNLVKTGSGTLVLSANGNIYGTTTISSGTLQVGAGGTTGSLGSGAVTNNGVLAFARSNSGTFANVISGGGTLRAASGTTSLTGANTFTGPVSIASGAMLDVGGAGTLGGGSYAGAITADGTLSVSTSGNQVLSGTISGAGAIAKSGASTLTLSAANTFAGGVSLASGTVSIADAAALGSGALSPTLAASSTLAYTTAAAGSIGNAITLGNPGATASTFAIVKSASAAATGTDLNLSGLITGGGTAATLFLSTNTPSDNSTTFTLSGSNTFRGTINLNRGALVVANASGLGDAANQVVLDTNVNGTLGNLRFAVSGTFANPIQIRTAGDPVSTGANNVVLSGVVSGTSLVKLGSGKLTLAATNTHVGTTISAGTLEVGNGGTAGTLGTGTVTNNATLAFNRSDAYGGAVSNVIVGTGAVTVAGGTLTLTAANTYSGATNIAAGAVVQVGNSGTTGSLGTGSVTNDGTLAFARTNSITVSNTIGGSGGLRVTSGTVVLTANNAYAGNTTVSGGVLRVGNGGTAGSLGATSGVVNDATLVFNRSDNYGGNVSAVISGTGAVTVSSGSLTLAGANTYSGNTTVASNATLALANVAALQNSAFVTSATGGSLAFTAPGTATYVLGNLTGDGAVNAGGNTLSVGGNGLGSTYSGNLTAAALVKQGAGVLTLTGSNTLGSTTISGGSVFAGSNNALGAGAVTLAGGLLQVGKGVTLANQIVLAGGAADVTFAGGLQLDYLLVGGGGGGAARDSGGGGGGGGVETGITSVIAGGTYTVAVGAGGAGADFGTGDGGGSMGGNGGSSSFGALSVLGGGGGAGYALAVGGTGATGGGGGRIGVGGPGTPGEGFNGGNGSGGTVVTDAGGGGGGAGGVGGNAVTNVRAGSGGIGLASAITGSSTFYGGGGGGAGRRASADNVTSGTGGLGGGGNASAPFGFAQNGVNGLGGGGGAARSDVNSGTASRVGGNGGSGTVIVRYLGGTAAVGGTATPGTGSALGYTLHTFTGTSPSSFVVNPVDVTIAGAMSGSGGFTWNSAATLALTGSNSYSGETLVLGGKLLVNGDQSAASGVVSIGSGAVLGGAGIIGGATVIYGTHSPGNSPGLQTFTNGIEYTNTGALVWELWANTTLGRGSAYDGVDITGGALSISPLATLQLDFGTSALGSTVDWTNSFWDADRQWTIIDVSGGATWDGGLFGSLVVGADALGQSLTTIRPDAKFSVTQDNGDFVLIYAAVPEPGSLGLAGIGLAAAGWMAARRRARRHASA